MSKNCSFVFCCFHCHRCKVCMCYRLPSFDFTYFRVLFYVCCFTVNSFFTITQQINSWVQFCMHRFVATLCIWVFSSWRTFSPILWVFILHGVFPWSVLGLHRPKSVVVCVVANPVIFLVSKLLSENITCCASLCVCVCVFYPHPSHLSYQVQCTHVTRQLYTGS